jgi:DNA invertase Pin-like site-specific DNA recombinase
MRVAVYLRISKDHAGEELGVDRQREDCLRYIAAKKDWQITRTYMDNDVSAFRSKPRPEFEAMLKAVKAGEVDVIVSKHLDRLLRRISELERVFVICEAAGAHIVTVSDGVDTATDGGRLVARILASVAQGEVERKGERQKRAMVQRAELGKGWGPRAFGYKEDDSGFVTKEANAIRKAYSDVLAGKTLFGVATDWNNKGFRTNRGGTWRGGTVKLVLINPRYIGMIQHKGTIVGPAQWKPIIDEETYESVVSILTDPSRQNVSSRARKYLLPSLIRCGCCGGWLSIGGKKERRLYACKHMGCHRIGRDMVGMDKLITDLVIERLSRPDAAEIFIKPQPNMRPLHDELKAKRRKLEQIGIDYADDAITRDQAKLATKKTEARISELENQIATSSLRGEAFADIDTDNPAEWFHALPLDRKRALIGMLMEITAIPVGRIGRPAAGLSGLDIRWRMDD